MARGNVNCGGGTVKLRNCVRCGALFASGGKSLWRECKKQEPDEFESVRSYLKEHPKAPLVEVSEATGVSVSKILDYVREGRLVVGTPGEAGLTCEQCGQPITTGRLCHRCARTLEMELRALSKPPVKDTILEQERPRDKTQIHFADR